MGDEAVSRTGPRPRSDGLLDANHVLELARRLHEQRDRITAADVSDEQRGRWLGRLQGIADGASEDLAKAVAQLNRLAAELDRSLPT